MAFPASWRLAAAASWALAVSERPPLVEPALVTPVLWSRPPDEYLARGVRVCEEGQWRLHVEALDFNHTALPLEPWQVVAIGSALEKALPEVKGGCAAEANAHNAVHCQADSITSVAADIRDGRFVHRLLQNLYQGSHGWTGRGINIGAGIDSFPFCKENDGYCNQDDPLDLWLWTEALQVLLVDKDGHRLQQVVEKTRANRLRVQDCEAVGVHRELTPPDVEAGELDEILLEIFEGKVDVLKVDVDSYDCALAQALLLKVEAAVVVLESQPLIPPPFKFARKFHSLDPLTQGVAGCSLSYQLQMLQPRYQLLVYSEHDTVFVRSDLVPDLEALPPGDDSSPGPSTRCASPSTLPTASAGPGSCTTPTRRTGLWADPEESG
ncbi:unnamed protein product [Effrenium voratum]|nr:unnamed protein product [Effrenium voratum]